MKICKNGHEREDGIRCLVCHREAANRRYHLKKEEVAEYSKVYRVKNKEYLCSYKKEWRRSNKKHLDNYQKLNKEKRRETQRLYEKKNKESIKKKKRIYVKEKHKTDPVFKLRRNLRTRLGGILKNKRKVGSAVKDLGCTGEELKLYLETLFEPGMSWKNYGNKEGQWSIDHIIPLSKVDLTNREEFLKVCHYTNLQPMWHIDNIKKSNKYEET